MKPMEAASFATSEIGLAVMATTFAIVAIFLPVAFMKGIIGRFFMQFALTVVFAVLVSLFISFTLTPMLASRYLKLANSSQNTVNREGVKTKKLFTGYRLLSTISNFLEKGYKKIEGVYRELLRIALNHRGVVIIMATFAAEEVEEMVSLAGALVLNIGTLSPPWIEAMLKPGKRANALHIPVILDPVGAGATRLRTDSAKRLIEGISIQVIRGNASEILSLGKDRPGSGTKGVDSVHTVDQATETANVLAMELRTTLAITGVVDLITNGERICRVMNGHEMMSVVTGTGCTATVIIGPFLAVCPNPLQTTCQIHAGWLD